MAEEGDVRMATEHQDGDESKSIGGGVNNVDVNDVLFTIPLSTFPTPDDGVVTVNSDMSLQEAVQVLQNANILAAPVVNVKAKATAPWSQRYLGLFDMTDVVWAAIQVEEISAAPMKVIEEDGGGDASAPPPVSFRSLMSSHAFFKTHTVMDVVRTFTFGPFVALNSKCSLLDAALVMGKYGQHRLMVVEGGNSSGLDNVITQSAMLRYLSQPAVAAKMAPVTSKTLAQLGLGASGKVYAVDLDDSVIQAFTVLAENHVSAVAVLDGSGKIVGTVSNRDARVIATSHHPITLLHSPVRSLFRTIAQQSIDIRHPSITAEPTDTLAFIIQKLVATRIHRVFVMGDGGLPVGVVSLTDVLAALVREPSEDYFASFFAEREAGVAVDEDMDDDA